MLTAKERAYLRSLAQGEPDNVLVGKDGLNKNVIAQIDEFIEANELLKVKMLPSCILAVKETAKEAAEAVRAEVVHTIGRKFVLYRRNPQNQRIFLPR